MIVVDTSAFLTIVLREPGYEQSLDLLMASHDRALPAPVLVEASIVLGRLQRDPQSMIDAHIAWLDLKITSLDEESARLAQQAWATYGKGKHPARRNFGDCLVYGTAKRLRARLLFIGDDFAQTDLAAP